MQPATTFIRYGINLCLYPARHVLHCTWLGWVALHLMSDAPPSLEPGAWMQDVKYPLELNHTASTYSPSPLRLTDDQRNFSMIESGQLESPDRGLGHQHHSYCEYLHSNVFKALSLNLHFLVCSNRIEYVHCKARPRVVQHWVKILPSPAAVYNVKTSRDRNTKQCEHQAPASSSKERVFSAGWRWLRV